MRVRVILSPQLFVLRILSVCAALAVGAAMPTEHRHAQREAEDVAALRMHVAPAVKPSYGWGNGTFLLDGQPFTMVACSLHYFRVPRALWSDRMQRARAMGCNTMETYLAWNMHQPKGPDQVPDFSGENDFIAWIDTAKALGLYVTLRPGPYICGEWEMGGLPAWLFKYHPNMNLRTWDTDFLRSLQPWWDTIMPMLRPYMHTEPEGGPILNMQLENEYGMTNDATGNPSDHRYILWLRNLTLKHIPSAQFYMVTPQSLDLSRSGIQGLILTYGDFGPECTSVAAYHAAAMSFNLKGAPYFNPEFHASHSVQWGQPDCGNVSAVVQASLLREIMVDFKGSVTFYMGLGGSTRGFMNGAACNSQQPSLQQYWPLISSYDHNAWVSEWGSQHLDPQGQNRFGLAQAVIRGALPHAPQFDWPPTPGYEAHAPQAPVGSAAFFANVEQLSVFSATSDAPLSFEDMNNFYGFALYASALPFSASIVRSGSSGGVVSIGGLRDRGHVFVDESLQGVAYRQDEAQDVTVQGTGGAKLHVLVENLGRCNAGKALKDLKGIVGNVSFIPSFAPDTPEGDAQVLSGWTSYAMPMEWDNVVNVTWQPPVPDAASGSVNLTQPMLYLYTLTLPPGRAPLDTFWLSAGWGKGVLYVNGVNAGRYWETLGPQHSIYIPGVMLQEGNNDIIVFELEQAPSNNPSIEFADHMVFSGP